jgi:hypothetical protein
MHPLDSSASSNFMENDDDEFDPVSLSVAGISLEDEL